ncbi:MAG: LamG domain-containing protein [Nanoarchaeota archaeon]
MKKLLFPTIILASLLLIIFVSAQFIEDGDTRELWHFDEGVGNEISDEASNNDGIISGANWTNDSISGFALSFDGINDFVTVPYSISIGELNALTLEAYIKRNSDSDGMIISKNGPYFLSVRNNVLEGGIYAGSGWMHINGTTELQKGKWYNIKLTYNGSTLKLFLDGVEESSLQKTGNIIVTSQALHIGWGEPGHNQFFNGTIDEIRISNIARNPSNPINSTNSTNPQNNTSFEDRIKMLENRIAELEDKVEDLDKKIVSLQSIIDKIKDKPKDKDSKDKKGNESHDDYEDDEDDDDEENDD